MCIVHVDEYPGNYSEYCVHVRAVVHSDTVSPVRTYVCIGKMHRAINRDI